jgi:hypothetical protein
MFMQTPSEKVYSSIVGEIAEISANWHKAGCLMAPVIEAIAKHCGTPLASLETGSGKSTLLFSHLSRHHLVFAWDRGDGSIKQVKESPLFNAENVEFIDGPTQQTLPAYQFHHKVQVALIDGPHGYPFPDLEYYYIYPLLEPNGILILDDIHIPNIQNIFQFLCKDEMFDLLEVVENTAFFKRTTAPLFDPLGDGWWKQGYNLPVYEAIKHQKSGDVFQKRETAQRLQNSGQHEKMSSTLVSRPANHVDWPRRVYRFKKWWKDRLPMPLQTVIRFLLRAFQKSQKTSE